MCLFCYIALALIRHIAACGEPSCLPLSSLPEIGVSPSPFYQ